MSKSRIVEHMKQRLRTVVISQPTYLPWLGYFRIMKDADVYVFLDNVQFEPRSWQCRNRIKIAKDSIFITVPTHHYKECRIRDVEIDDSKPWRRQHWNAIRTSYGKAPYFKNHAPFFKSVYERKWPKLALLNVELIRYVASQLDLPPTFVLASKLEVTGKRTELLLNICEMFGAQRYLSSIGAYEYMKKDCAAELFREKSIKVEFLRFSSPTYPQLFGEFIPNLSVIDCLFNCGPDSARVMSNEDVATYSNL
jgi:hypothetical protein